MGTSYQPPMVSVRSCAFTWIRRTHGPGGRSTGTTDPTDDGSMAAHDVALALRERVAMREGGRDRGHREVEISHPSPRVMCSPRPRGRVTTAMPSTGA